VTHKFHGWDSVAFETMSDRISRKVATGKKAMVARVFLKKSAEALETLVRAAERYGKGRQASKQLKRVFSP
jgi:hypothetical protein